MLNHYPDRPLCRKPDRTLWSYLATPPHVSGDVAKNLSISIVKNLAAFLDHVESLPRPASLPQARSDVMDIPGDATTCVRRCGKNPLDKHCQEPSCIPGPC